MSLRCRNITKFYLGVEYQRGNLSRVLVYLAAKFKGIQFRYFDLKYAILKNSSHILPTQSSQRQTLLKAPRLTRLYPAVNVEQLCLTFSACIDIALHMTGGRIASTWSCRNQVSPIVDSKLKHVGELVQRARLPRPDGQEPSMEWFLETSSTSQMKINEYLSFAPQGPFTLLHWPTRWQSLNLIIHSPKQRYDEFICGSACTWCSAQGNLQAKSWL